MWQQRIKNKDITKKNGHKHQRRAESDERLCHIYAGCKMTG